MGQSFIACDRDQSFLMPPDVREWLAPGHLAWFVLDAVSAMDLEAFYGAYRRDGRSRPAYEPAMMGWIQLVVATLEVEELRCLGRTVRGIVLRRQGRVAKGLRLLVVGNIGSGSGRRSLEGHRARTLRWKRVSWRALASGGFARVAAWRLSPSRRCPGVICPSASGRRSRCCWPAVLGCARSRVASVVRRRRSPGNCNAMLRCAPAVPSTGPRLPRRMLTGAREDPSRRSSR